MLFLFWSSINRLFFRDKLILSNAIIGLVLNIILWLLPYYRMPFLVERAASIPLHYNIYFGIDLIGDGYKIFMIPLAGIFIYVVNLILAYLFFSRDKILSYFLIFTSTLIQILLIMAISVVIWINI